MKPFAGLVRLDTFGYPVVIPTGSVFVTAGTDRRSSGTHYTPREPDRTDRPVHAGAAGLRRPRRGDAEGPVEAEVGQGTARPEDLRHGLRLRGVPGAGLPLPGGAAARSVGGGRAAGQPRHAPDHARRRALDRGLPERATDPRSTADERQTYALRIVAQRCLYGVDKNPLAVEMAKLSLWLLTLAKDKPFEFLDHAIRCGDSLVGLSSIDQLLRFSLDGERQGQADCSSSSDSRSRSGSTPRCCFASRSRRCPRTRRRTSSGRR